METEGAEKTIAELVKEEGGRTFYVGGCVRDRILGIENKDVDIEVYGIEPGRLYDILKKVGEPLSFGSSFGIYSLKDTHIAVAMPRKEHATGRGHRDFEIYVDPWSDTKSAARRRDFTMNSLMEDVLTGEIIDHFGGRCDIEKKIIRHVDKDSFIEDPLRVFRAAQFASRFGFTAAPETVELCRNMDLSALSRERVEEELQKALLKGRRPSVFFSVLREMDQLDVWFPELRSCIGVEQDPKFHPEGDVWVHTMEVLDRAAWYRGKVSDPYAFMLLALAHDLGKIITTEEIDGRIHAYGHETEGMPLAESFVRRITGETAVIDYVLNMVPLHMKPNMVAYSKSAVKVTNKLFDEAAAPEDLIYFAMCDRPLFSGDDPFEGDSAFLFERLKVYEETMAKPHVSGQDLIDAGLEPGPYFGEVLGYAHKLRLAGIDKKSALKQTLSYARQYVKKETKEEGI